MTAKPQDCVSEGPGATGAVLGAWQQTTWPPVCVWAAWTHAKRPVSKTAKSRTCFPHTHPHTPHHPLQHPARKESFVPSPPPVFVFCVKCFCCRPEESTNQFATFQAPGTSPARRERLPERQQQHPTAWGPGGRGRGAWNSEPASKGGAPPQGSPGDFAAAPARGILTVCAQRLVRETTSGPGPSFPPAPHGRWRRRLCREGGRERETL